MVKSCTFLTETLQGAHIMKPVKISLVQERTWRSPAVSSLKFSRGRLAFRVCCNVITMCGLNRNVGQTCCLW